MVILARVDAAYVLPVRRIVDEVLRKAAVLGAGTENHELFRDRVDPIGGNEIAGEYLAGFRSHVVGRRMVDGASQTEKSPDLIAAVGIVLFTVEDSLRFRVSQAKKKNALFLTTGPPTVNP